MRPCPGPAYGVMPLSRSPLKLILPSTEPFIPAGPDSSVGRGPGPLMRASVNLMPLPDNPPKKLLSDIVTYTLLYIQEQNYTLNRHDKLGPFREILRRPQRSQIRKMEALALLLEVGQVEACTRPPMVHMPFALVFPGHAWLELLLNMLTKELNRTPE